MAQVILSNVRVLAPLRRESAKSSESRKQSFRIEAHLRWCNRQILYPRPPPPPVFHPTLPHFYFSCCLSFEKEKEETRETGQSGLVNNFKPEALLMARHSWELSQWISYSSVNESIAWHFAVDVQCYSWFAHPLIRIVDTGAVSSSCRRRCCQQSRTGEEVAVVIKWPSCYATFYRHWCHCCYRCCCCFLIVGMLSRHNAGVVVLFAGYFLSERLEVVLRWLVAVGDADGWADYND